VSLVELSETGPAQSEAGHFFTPVRAVGFLMAFGVAALVALPLFGVLRFAVQGDAELWPHLAAYVLPNAIWQTALLLLGVAILTVATGMGAAWLVTTFEFPWRRALLWLLPLPLAIPTYISAYVYADLLDAGGPVQAALRGMLGIKSGAVLPPMQSLWGAIFVISAVLYPYVYLATRAMFQTNCAIFIDAARTLGASPLRLARDITVPLARPALAVGVSLALLETLNDIGASEYLGVQTLTLTIFTTWLARGSLGGAAQIAVAMLILVAGLIALERYGRRNERYNTSLQDARVADRVALHGWRKWLVTALCLLPVVIGFMIPAAVLVNETIKRHLLMGFDSTLLHAGMNTVWLAAIATVATLLLGLGAVVPLRLLRHPFVLACATIATLGYALPATVLSLGLLSPLVGIDEALNWLTRHLTGSPVGLLIAGSSAALIIAYSVRFLAISIGFLHSGFARLSPELDEAARMLGAGPMTLVRSVHLPLLRPALWGAALLIFIDCLKELPATLLLRPLNVDTLSTYIYQFATRGNFEEGALAALLIVLAGTLPVMRIVHLSETVHSKARSHPPGR
jgi:iron(III) transport system permease protein